MSAPIAVSSGDPTGIGPEIVSKAWLSRAQTGVRPFFHLTDPDHFVFCLRKAAIDCPVIECSPEEASEVFVRALPAVALENSYKGDPGKPQSANAAGIVEAIERAVGCCFDGSAAAVATGPIAKSVLYEAGFKFPGHTEFLAHLCARNTGNPVTPVMMLAGPELRTVPVTIHIPLSDVPAALTPEIIVETATITAGDLVARFGLNTPRLAISGLNPHAGEDGALGREEKDIIEPAVAELKTRGIDARGPLPADTMFHAAARKTYDAAICMYHDQALVPAKALAFDEAVNVTLGLPIIRTSPDHGTAFDIAGKGIARETSLVAALKMAAGMAEHAAR